MKEKKLLYGITIILLFLLARVFFISVICGDKYSEYAKKQRTSTIELSERRGVIYDRNLIPITEAENIFFEVMPSREKGGIEISEIPENADYKKDKNTKIFSTVKRYRKDGFLSHVIGYRAENGGYGVEAVFNDLLKDGGQDEISVVKDAQNNVIDGFGISRTSKKIKSGVILSIDYHIQSAVENAVDKSEYPCAAVVVDIASGDIVAMASRPTFDAENVAKSLKSNNGELINRAVSAYDAGSVFKTVVAAAALEEGIVSPATSFYCSGEYKIGDTTFYCNKREGHGQLTLTEGFGLSCNCVFFEVGQSLGSKTLLKYARHFGFGEKILKAEGFFESGGKLPASPTRGQLANLSIGQGELLVTPLQVTDMMCTIAGGGTRKVLRISCGTADKDGTPQYTESLNIDRIISESTASALREMLIYAVQMGTGQTARPECRAGGKTGSAESGWHKNGEQMVHGWFAGFFPAENPKYVCTVLCENGKTGSSSASPIFKEIADSIYFFKKF